MGLDLLKAAAHDQNMAEEVRSMMERQTKQMVRLIDDLLDISRITRGKLELQKSQVALSDVVQSAVDATRRLVEEAEHQLVIKLPDEQVFLYADSNRLTQVVTNLLNNAAKYTPPGGRVELAAELDDGHVALAVTDNGCGIPSDRLDSIFEMFSQVGGAKESGHQGLGIGLNLVKRLVEMHGGDVAVQSGGHNQGSRFSVRLPVSQCASHVNGRDALGVQTVPPPPKCRVLVVDDNLDARTSLGMLIKLRGCEVYQAQDGQEAIEAAERLRPEIVFMDIGMPKLNGYEAARRIREEPWGEHMVLVATTGWGQAEDRRRSHEAGFDRHCVKPVNPAELTELMVAAASAPVAARKWNHANGSTNALADWTEINRANVCARQPKETTVVAR
jgi:CheY-like chemotaxis protein/two-component sensor histidine kinase